MSIIEQKHQAEQTEGPYIDPLDRAERVIIGAGVSAALVIAAGVVWFFA